MWHSVTRVPVLLTSSWPLSLGLGGQVNRARTPPGYVHRRDSSNASSLSYDEQVGRQHATPHLLTLSLT